MMKKIIALLTATVITVGTFVGCGGGKDSAQTKDGSKKLVVYSPNSEDIVNTIVPLFEDETGITVELVSAGTGELFKRLQSEKDNSYADVIFGGSMAQYVQNPDLFEPYVAKYNDDLVEGHRNVNGYVTTYGSDGSVLLVNKNLIGNIKIKGYKDLLNPELKGKIAASDPATSSSSFAQLTNILLAMGGDYTSDAGWNYVKSLVANLDGKVANGSGAVHKSVADGEFVVGLTYEDPSVSYVKNGGNVEVVYPEEGAVFLDPGSAIIKGAKNMDNAKLFMDFLTSKKAQDAFGTQLTIRPLRKDAELADYMKPLKDIKLLEEDRNYVFEHKKEIAEKYTEIFTNAKN
ncbi:ABC transporter substrate-binding protein [Clostridium sp. CTA-7]